MRNLWYNVLAMVFVFVVTLVDNAEALERKIKFNGDEYYLEEMVSQYHTNFDLKQKSRNNNLRRASSLINGRIILPNQNVSFNEWVGSRTKERGFTKAPSFANGKVITSVGGGICQVSSTWFAATIQLGLKVVERHRHSLPITYISPDKEAAVAWRGKDFRFKNNTKNILYVRSFIIKNRIYVEYWKCRQV